MLDQLAATSQRTSVPPASAAQSVHSTDSQVDATEEPDAPRGKAAASKKKKPVAAAEQPAPSQEAPASGYGFIGSAISAVSSSVLGSVKSRARKSSTPDMEATHAAGAGFNPNRQPRNRGRSGGGGNRTLRSRSPPSGNRLNGAQTVRYQQSRRTRQSPTRFDGDRVDVGAKWNPRDARKNYDSLFFMIRIEHPKTFG